MKVYHCSKVFKIKKKIINLRLKHYRRMAMSMFYSSDSLADLFTEALPTAILKLIFL